MSDCEWPNVSEYAILNSYPDVRDRFETRCTPVRGKFIVKVLNDSGVLQGHVTLTRAALAASYGNAFYFNRGVKKKFIKMYLGDVLACAER